MAESIQITITGEEQREVNTRISDEITEILADLDFWFDQKERGGEDWPLRKRLAAVKASGLSDISDAYEEYIHEANL